jgi:hypothetical protein
MDKYLESARSDYSDLIEQFSENVVIGIVDNCKERMSAFINSNNLSDNVKISDRNLWFAVLSFLSDIKRIKDYQPIEYVSSIKDYSYLAFWLLRKKAIQVTNDFDSSERINEKFTTLMLLKFLHGDSVDETHISENHKEFMQTLYYTFSYREFTAKGIELVLLGFKAGNSM